MRLSLLLAVLLGLSYVRAQDPDCANIADIHAENQEPCTSVCGCSWGDQGDTMNDESCYNDGEECGDVVVQVGEECYCGTTTTAPPSPATPAPVSSHSHSHSKDAKKGSKDGSDGMGVGECSCDKTYGMVEIRFIYEGTTNSVDIQMTTKDEDVICGFGNVDKGDELTCNVKTTTYGNVEKLSTNTYFEISSNGDVICNDEIHTSCSSDIVGTYSTGDCEALFVTGWKDGNDIANDCDDGLENCSCEEGSITYPEDPVEEETDTDTIQRGDVCYCTNLDTDPPSAFDTPSPTTPSPTTPSPTGADGEDDGTPGRRRLGKSKSASKSKSKSKSSSKDDGLGHGDCDCSGGMAMIRFVYGTTGNNADAEAIDVYYEDDKTADPLCTFSDVKPGDELECALEVGVSPEKLDKNTYIDITYDDTTSLNCYGSFHTSCSRDIVGYTAEGCDDVMVTGWSDNDNSGDDECDDGYDRCDCPTNGGATMQWTVAVFFVVGAALLR